MGNFVRRVISFILGMVFMLVVVAGGVAGGVYWAYKNLTLDKVGAGEGGLELGDAGDWTIEDWHAIILKANTDPQGFTLDMLEDHGFDVDTLLLSMGVDVTTADAVDVQELKNVSISALIGGEALNTASLGVLLPFLPKDAEGNNVLFSTGARNLLRRYTLAEAFGTDPITAKPKILTILRQLPIGSIAPTAFTETANGTGYVYGAEHKALNLIANVKLSLLTDALGGEPFNFTDEILNGELKELGNTELREIIASFSGSTQEAYDGVYASLESLGNTLLKDLYTFNEETQEYTFDFASVINLFTVGSLMGMTPCTENDDCSIHEDVADCDGKLYDREGAVIELAGLEATIMYNLAQLGIGELLGGGFDIGAMLEGAYLGSAFGYKIGAKAGYCEEDCDIAGEHTHNFYWVDSSDNFVGTMFNKLANVSLTDVMEGNLNIDGIITTTKIGDIFGYVYDETESRWEDGEGNPVANETISDKVMYALYGKTIDDLSSGLDIASALDGVYLGEALGYEIGAKSGYCEEDCDIAGEHTHNFYWVDSSNAFVGELYNSLANVALADVINGNLDIDGIVSTTKIGDIFGYVYDETESRWEDASGNPVANETISEKVMYAIYGKTIEDLSSGLDIATALDGVYLGETFGYKLGAKSGYCEEDCDIAGEHTHKFYWVDSSDAFVGELYNSLANVALADVIDGNFNIQSIIEGLKIGDIFGYVYDETESRWEEQNGTPLQRDTVSQKVLYSLYSKTVDDLTSGLDIGEMLSGVYFGELLGYTKSGDYWFSDSNKVDNFYQAIANIEVSSLINGDTDIKTAISGVYVGDLMGYVYDTTDNRWETSTNGELSSVQKMLAEIKLSEIFGGLDLTTKINGLKLGDVIDPGTNKILNFLADAEIGNLTTKINALTIDDVITIDGSNKVLLALTGTKITDLSSEINELKIGKLMGYVYDETESRWEDSEGNEITGISKKVSDLTVYEMGNGGFEGLTFVLGDVLDSTTLSKGVFSLIKPGTYGTVDNIPVSALSTKMQESISSSTYAQLVEAEIINSVENPETLDKLFYVYKGGYESLDDARAYWTSRTVTALMNEVISIIDSMMPNS